MSHHLSGANLQPPLGDPRLDMTDLFVFPAKTEGRTAIVLDANLDPAGAPGLHPDAVYQVHIDTDGDLRPDITYHFTFSELDDAGQTVTVLQAKGEQAGGMEPVGTTLASDLVVGMSGEITEGTSEGHRFAVALRSDPFFADVKGLFHEFKWTGSDARADANIYGIVMEVPGSELGDGPISVWGRVVLSRPDGYEPVDRGANGLVTAFFNPDNDEKIAYNRGTPATDEADHLDRFAGVLEHIGGWEAGPARETLLATIVPDVLRWDRHRRTAYPNGRSLTDDVTSARLTMLTNGKITTDNIAPHTDLLDDFPYLGRPHPAADADSFRT